MRASSRICATVSLANSNAQICINCLKVRAIALVILATIIVEAATAADKSTKFAALCSAPGQCSRFTTEPNQSLRRLAAGAECPARSGKFCKDELPWCCVSASGDAYCAKDTTGCTK